MAEPDITREEFCRRFVSYMLSRGGENFDDGESVRQYAEEIAQTYWADPDQRVEGPEECADADMSYWGE